MADLTKLELELPSMDLTGQTRPNQTGQIQNLALETVSKATLTPKNENTAQKIASLELEEEEDEDEDEDEDEEDFSQQCLKHLKPGMRVVVMKFGWRRVPNYLDREWAEVIEVKRRVVKAKTKTRTVVTSIIVRPVDARPPEHIRAASQFIVGPQNIYLVESEERRLEREHLREQLRLIAEYHKND